ncbi:MAG: hypothetical protein HY927_02475 [Elusimicrobia bacterium]|nr:hypothetical protein [Elusimicrobiota bacterium]
MTQGQADALVKGDRAAALCRLFLRDEQGYLSFGAGRSKALADICTLIPAPPSSNFCRRWPRLYGLTLIIFALATGAFFGRTDLDGLPRNLRQTVVLLFFLPPLAGSFGSMYAAFGLEFHEWCERHYPSGYPKSWRASLGMLAFIAASGALCWLSFPEFRNVVRLGLRRDSDRSANAPI